MSHEQYSSSLKLRHQCLDQRDCHGRGTVERGCSSSRLTGQWCASRCFGGWGARLPARRPPLPGGLAPRHHRLAACRRPPRPRRCSSDLGCAAAPSGIRTAQPGVLRARARMGVAPGSRRPSVCRDSAVPIGPRQGPSGVISPDRPPASHHVTLCQKNGGTRNDRAAAAAAPPPASGTRGRGTGPPWRARLPPPTGITLNPDPEPRHPVGGLHLLLRCNFFQRHKQNIAPPAAVAGSRRCGGKPPPAPPPALLRME